MPLFPASHLSFFLCGQISQPPHGCPSSFTSLVTSAIKVHFTADRIAGHISPDAALKSARGKAVYVFKAGDANGRPPVYGSREGQHCRFRIVMECASCGLVLDDSIAVQVFHPSTQKRLPLDIRVANTSRQKWPLRLNAFLPGEALRGIAADEPSTNRSMKPKRRDFTFQLCTYMKLPDVSDSMLVARGTVTWRLLHPYTPMCGHFIRHMGFCAWTQMPQSWRSCLSSSAGQRRNALPRGPLSDWMCGETDVTFETRSQA